MESIWEHNAPTQKFKSLGGDKSTDVAIVGGGLCGILLAYFLGNNNIPYVLLEKGRIARATTAHTTGKITAQHGLIYDNITKEYGIEHALGYYRANMLALEKYRQLCENISCDFEEKDNFVYSKNDREKLEREFSALEKIGVNAKLTDTVPLPVETVGAVAMPSQAQFNPLKFISHISRDLNIYENTFVKDIKDCTVYTDKGSVKATAIAVTTHFPIVNRHGFYFLKMYQHRSYALALHEAEDVNGMYVDEDNTGLSFRNYKNFLILGGGGHRTGKKGGSYEQLREIARKYYPKSREKYAWAAQDCISLDSIPYIGRYSKRTENLYTATGFNKWGMTGSMLSALLLCDAICGIKNEFFEIFKPSRSIIHPQLFLNTAETVKNLLTLTAPRCSHLGCALKWNKAEHSWDCSCHGSRFSESGEILDTPANKELKNK